MAKEQSRGDDFRGLEIQVDGEIGGEGDPESWSDASADDSWPPTRKRWAERRKPVPWRTVAWVAVVALLGFGIGALAEPSAKQAVAGGGPTGIDLNFDNQSITAPGMAQMAKLTGAAWSVSPVTTLVVHVVNDGQATVHLHTGTLAGQHISHGALIPEGTGSLAPGQGAALTAKVTLECNSKPSDAVSGAAVQPLTAIIPVSVGDGPSADVQLVAGSKQDDLYTASQLCAGLPQPLKVSFQNVQGAAAQGGEAIRVTVHNITGQPIRYVPEFGFQNVDVAEMQEIAAGATIVVDVPLAQICTAVGQSPTSPTVGMYMATADGSYQIGYEESVGSIPGNSVCHD